MALELDLIMNEYTLENVCYKIHTSIHLVKLKIKISE